MVTTDMPGTHDDGEAEGRYQIMNTHSDDDSREAEGLHQLMADATGHLSGVRVDVPRLRRARRTRRLTGAGVAFGAVAAVAAGVLFAPLQPAGSGPAAPPTAASTPKSQALPQHTPTPDPGPFRPVGVSVYDPAGGVGGSGDPRGLIDGGSVGWGTDRYCTSRPTRHGAAVPGVGLVFDLGRPEPVGRVDLAVKMDGATLEMWAAPPGQATAPVTVPGAPPAEFTKVATGTAADSRVLLEPAQPVTTRYVLVWFTSLPVTGPDTDRLCAGSEHQLHSDVIVRVAFRRG